MEVASASGNSQRLLHLIRSTGGRRIPVSEIICDKSEQSIHNKEQRLDRWAAYFGEQFNWSSANVVIPAIAAETPWVVTCTSYNGFANDDLSTSVAGLSKTELEQLLNDTEEIKKIAKSSSQVKKSIADKESLMQQNRRLAETNLALEPQFLVKKHDLADLYQRLSEARERYADLKSRIDALGSNYNPSTILALIQAANAEAEEGSEVSQPFISQ
ncbi:unnamed protein product [Echinostoma caproni]|uniref:VPS37 C-terminal domain-containing protein n=1 Tax=Echinostoma caproni TaxID=27848 RepID=A0A183B1V8_9TREM|nr:unnamed protein product [Echinostoma caproni]